MPTDIRTRAANALRLFAIAATAFLTLADLFAAQAILPFLATAYHVSAGTMSAAVNASTIGMAAGGLTVALCGGRIDRRLGMIAGLALLALPTLALSILPPLPVFTLSRIVQGLCMSVAFALMLAHLGERSAPGQAAAAFAAYVTGNVASNLFGRMISAGVADHFGLAANFKVFAVLNLAGAALVWCTVKPAARPAAAGQAWRDHLRDPRLLASFGIGFCILFAFIGTFTFVNFILVRAPLGLGMMQIGFVYLVFLPAVATTPLAGLTVRLLGVRPSIWVALLAAAAGLPLLVSSSLSLVLTGMVAISAGTFFAQAVTTGFVSRTARTDRASASGIYLASYFAGGLAGSLVLGQIFDSAGWPACVVGIGVAVVAAAVLTVRLRDIVPHLSPITAT